MKKRISAVLAAVLTLSMLLTGCTEPNPLVGKWTMQTSYAELTGGTPSETELGNLAGYVDFSGLYLTSTYTFEEDKTYTFRSDVEQYIKDCRTVWIEGINAYYEDQIAERNLAITVEEAWELDGISAEELVDAESIRAAFADTNRTGNYRVREGKLFLSAGLEYRVDETVYTVFTLEGDTLTFTSSAGGEPGMEFPVTLTKGE